MSSELIIRRGWARAAGQAMKLSPVRSTSSGCTSHPMRHSAGVLHSLCSLPSPEPQSSRPPPLSRKHPLSARSPVAPAARESRIFSRGIQRISSSSRARAAADGAGSGPAATDSRELKPEPYAWPEGTRRPRVCILGGGFGGLYTALRLDSLIWTPERRPQVLLVDQADRFVFKPLLYELLTKEVTVWEIAPSFHDLLRNTRIQFLQGRVAAVEPRDEGEAAPGGGNITLSNGSRVDYDWLILSLGAETVLSFCPGAQELALPFATLRDALAVESRLTELERAQFRGVSKRPIRVLVVGAGYSGVELACTVAERLGERGQVQIVDPADRICPAAPPANREAAEKALREKGVEILLGTRVVSVAGTGSESESGSESEAHSQRSACLSAYPFSVRTSTAARAADADVAVDLVLWTVGNRPVVPPGSDAAPLFPVTGRGQAEVEPSLRVKGHLNVFALGDAAAFVSPGAERPLAGTAQVAFQQADYVGWNIWASINGRPLLPFRYQHLGEMMTLGSTDGAVSLGFFDNFFIGGRLAHTARKLAYLYRLPTFNHQAKVGLSWLGKTVVDAITEVQTALAKATLPQR